MHNQKILVITKFTFLQYYISRQLIQNTIDHLSSKLKLTLEI